MVIFTKISILGLLFLSAINTSESRHRHHQHHDQKRSRQCKCEATEPDPTEETILQATETSLRTTTTDNKPRQEEVATTKITSGKEEIPDGNNSGKPLSLSLLPLYDIRKKVKPEKKESLKSRAQPTPIIIGHIDHRESLYPTDNEVILRNWILNHPDSKQKISFRNEIKHFNFPSESRLNRPLYTQEHSQQHYLRAPDYSYDIDPLLSRGVMNPYRYVVQTQESINPQKKVHLSSVDDRSDKFYPLHQNGFDTELKQIELPHVGVLQNQHFPPYAQTVPLPIDFQTAHEYRYGDLNNGYQVPVSHISGNNLPLKQMNIVNNDEKWVEGNIKILNGETKRTDKIDINELCYAVLQILSQNGMHVTENGMLIDAQGTKFNIQTLNLTPILIGNTLSLRNLLQGKYAADSQTPYLQAVLVTSSNPSKVLGIMPLGTTYLPDSLTSISGLANTKHFSGKYKLIKTNSANKPTVGAIKTITGKNKSKKVNVLYRGDDEEEMKTIPLPISNKIDMNGVNNNIGWNPLSSSLKSARYYIPNNIEDLPQDIQAISRTDLLRDEDAIDQDASLARLFLPQMGLRKAVDLLSNHDPELDSTINDAAYSRIEIPALSNLFDFALKSKSFPLNVKSLLEFNNEADTQKASPVPDIFETAQDHKLNVLQDLNVNGNVPSVGGETVFTRRLNVPIRTLAVTHSPIYRKSFNIHTIPIGYSRVNDLKTIPDLDFATKELGVSRSGGQYQVPEIPPEVNNGNSVVDVAENYDDDDGDFRIIGGNAATGSGTPLSNKGRSGYIA